ncbi:aminopeptidase [Enterococcus sp. LJL90]
MNSNFLKALSNADGIASNEKEVRQAILAEVGKLPYEKTTDGLGSLIFTKRSQQSDKSIMICGHMDEVGFMVRSISELGLIHLMVVGGVKPLAQHLQKVRITTFDGRKISAVINGDFQNGTTENLYCDLGATSAEEVAALGIEVGNMVCYATEFEAFAVKNIYAGKAFDDRLACFVMAELMKELVEVELPLTVHFANTSSEEVGIRGAKTAVQKINPDIVFVIDVATFSTQFVRNHTNQRQIGAGPILTHFDRTLAPNLEMLQYVKKTAKKAELPLQLDMFNAGGTDGGEAHKVNDGKPTVVTILPVRYGHCAYSIVNGQDVDQMIALYKQLLLDFNEETYRRMVNFI